MNPPPRAGADAVLVGAIASLVAIGLVMIFSASSAYAVALQHDAGYFLKRQLLWLVVAIALAYAAYRIDYRKLRRVAPYTALLGIVLLSIVRIPHVGTIAGGARRWLAFGPVQFEPSEFAKLALVLYLAGALASRGDRIRSLTRGVFPLAFVTGVMGILVIMQPDFGTASLLVFTAAIMLFVAGARPVHLLLVAAVVTPPAALLIRNDPYKLARIVAFMDPWKDPQDKGFHIVQSLMALGSGSWFGVGLGFSHQKFFWLPEAHTDFIASIIGEETGFAGMALIVGLFVLFAYRSVRIALTASDRFGFFLAIGAMSLIVVQAFVNLGVVSSSWPVTGVPLPFISFGGSSLVTSLIAVALVANVGRSRQVMRRPTERDEAPPAAPAEPRLFVTRA